jgi:hypothetical protein
MAALQQAAGQAQSMRGADLATAQATRGAEDEFARFRAQEAIARQRSNIAAQNLAQQRNIEREQGLSNLNIGATNRERERQVVARGTDWDRGLAYGQARAAPRTQMAAGYGQKAAATQQGWGDVGKGVSDIFGTAVASQRADRQYDLDRESLDVTKKIHGIV